MHSTGERVAVRLAGRLRIDELIGGREIADAVVQVSSFHQTVIANRALARSLTSELPVQLAVQLVVQMDRVQVRGVRLRESRVIGQVQVGAVMLSTGCRLVTGGRIITATRATVAIRTVGIRTFDQVQAAALSSMHCGRSRG